ncbi:MFS transporter [Pseudoblastomonas halimionae]|uniref:MFS transporter n=1 Tax=Alteriqipengyuania halimionae TaxID=1926630 RepID=A0A6I4U354_9SPHN|nr:MFS transporter [Alteriqipengyuania halimionae]MXP10358.1 MFS transporter [Alteriqipengyuania halimionae]
MTEPARLTTAQEYWLAVAAAVVTANAYYIHPIIGDVARHFGVSASQIGWVPALNQLALALGILLLLPLGDRYSNRTLTILFTIGQCAGLIVMTLAEGYGLFTAGSTLLGFFTIAPYLLPAYASKRVAPERLGQVTALLTAGIIFGILVARVGAGVVAEHYGWRTVYWFASGLMIAITLALPTIMEKGVRDKDPSRLPYLGLIASLLVLLRERREIVLSGAIQGLGFAQFIALWLALALHLTGPEMGYGTDVVGYLAGFAAVSVFSTPYWGRLADRIGPRKARVGFAVVQAAGIALLIPFGYNLWLLMIPLLLGNIVGPAIDVTSRMTFLSLEPELRTRLTTIYIVMMFIGGGIGSIAGTALFEAFGWTGAALAILASCVTLTVIAIVGYRIYGHRDGKG